MGELRPSSPTLKSIITSLTPIHSHKMPSLNINSVASENLMMKDRASLTTNFAARRRERISVVTSTTPQNVHKNTKNGEESLRNKVDVISKVSNVENAIQNHNNVLQSTTPSASLLSVPKLAPISTARLSFAQRRRQTRGQTGGGDRLSIVTLNQTNMKRVWNPTETVNDAAPFTSKEHEAGAKDDGEDRDKIAQIDNHDTKALTTTLTREVNREMALVLVENEKKVEANDNVQGGNWWKNMLMDIREGFWINWATRWQRDRIVNEEMQQVVLGAHWQEPRIESKQLVLDQSPPNAVLALTSLETGILCENLNLLHPILRVTAVDLCTGTLLAKQDPKRAVVAHYEVVTSEHGETRQFGSILPQQTKPCPFLGRGELAAKWEDTFIFNQPIESFMERRTLLLFELMDFGPHLNNQTFPDGYYRIAWAFLKVVDMRGGINYGPIRLQLYEYIHNRPKITRSHVPDVYFEWVYQRNVGYRPYPTWLALRLQGVAAPIPIKVSGRRPLLPTDIEVGRIPYRIMQQQRMGGHTGELQVEEDREANESFDDSVSLDRRARKRQRSSYQQCLVPCVPLYQTSCGQLGCFVLAFSPDGRYLACASGEYVMFPLKIYDSDTGVLLFTFSGHHDLIHDVVWSNDTSQILTASSDHTAKIWDFHNRIANDIRLMQHSSYVYAARYVGSTTWIVTAAYDGVVRIFDYEFSQPRLLHALSDHQGSIVNTLSCAPDGSMFFSGDNKGHIRVWKTPVNVDTKAPPGMDLLSEQALFRCIKTVKHEQLGGANISNLQYDAQQQILVAYCRDNAIYLFGTRRYDLKRKLGGVMSNSQPMRCTISPDGTMLLAGSEDGCAYCWNIESGQMLNKLDTGFHSPVYAIAWHPTQHMVAYGSFGSDFPIATFDKESEALQNAAGALNADVTASMTPRSTTSPTRKMLLPWAVDQ